VITGSEARHGLLSDLAAGRVVKAKHRGPGLRHCEVDGQRASSRIGRETKPERLGGSRALTLQGQDLETGRPVCDVDVGARTGRRTAGARGRSNGPEAQALDQARRDRHEADVGRGDVALTPGVVPSGHDRPVGFQAQTEGSARGDPHKTSIR
jgi:hypothetical protein